MSTIKLKEPWCFNSGGFTHKEVEDLQEIFVDKVNESYSWIIFRKINS